MLYQQEIVDILFKYFCFESYYTLDKFIVTLSVGFFKNTSYEINVKVICLMLFNNILQLTVDIMEK